ncbi:unnamed protein product [Rhizoctonia solani]|uniref:Ribonuclease n=1 Tax=Rhizoctonia solani AG-3 Rhs1AP TaxID=1086054 RepID=X8JX65_9AGAM|nr:ribonuclease [Rhizoctonia solani AG-3 Rhs1AP]CAE6467948.1 unnamed protein product [Rhizoctonia solani]
MVAFIWNLALLALAVPALAIPAPSETLDLSKRTITDIKQAGCGGTKFFSRAQVQAAAQAAVNHQRAGTTVGFNNYPHEFFNSPDNVPFQAGCNAPWFEFPILSNRQIFTGASGPGPDRVVIGSISNTANDAVLCGVMTHTGAPNPGLFVGCNLS